MRQLQKIFKCELKFYFYDGPSILTIETTFKLTSLSTQAQLHKTNDDPHIRTLHVAVTSLKNYPDDK